jgi:hypothetical protein
LLFILLFQKFLSSLFFELQIIKIRTKSAHGIDDGWWEGELDGKIGNFPSLVVEDCDEHGEPITDPEDQTPPPTAPPGCAPPTFENHFADFENMESITRDGKI